MALALLLRACWLLLLAESASARFARDLPILNTTSSSIETAALTSDHSQWRGHIESTASITVLAPDEPTSSKSKVVRVTSTPGDVGDIIQSAVQPSSRNLFTNSMGKIRIESTETGWGGSPTSSRGGGGRVPSTPTPSPTPAPEESDTWDGVWPTGSMDNWRPHLESSADGLHADQPVTDSEPTVTPPPMLPTITVDSRVYSPKPVTNIKVDDKTLVPGGDTATYGEGPSATKVYVDPSGHPVVVVGTSTSTYQAPVTVGDKTGYALPTGGLVVDGQTLTQGGAPVTVDTGSGPTTLSIDASGETLAIANGQTKTYEAPATQALNLGEITATAVANDEYIVGSSTLTLGQVITSDGTTIALTTDAAGATILIDGTTTTTLAPPSGPMSVQTTVISGTTEYIIGSQTLAPGHPVTVNGVPMEISTSAGTTVLVIGDMTTTIQGPASTTFSTGFGGTDVGVATPVDATAAPSQTGKEGGAQRVGMEMWGIGVAAVVAVVGLG